MAQILVTGGLGFIGSHTVVALINAGFEPVILDNLSNSTPEVLEGISRLCGKEPCFIKGDVNDPGIYPAIFEQFDIEAVIHFAAYKAVGESVEQPLKYYANNVSGLILLLQKMKQYEVKNIVFSSSCTIYGQPDVIPVTESTPMKPASSPYGNTKQMGENILQSCTEFNSISLRYFNPVGAHPEGAIGELPVNVPSNLIPYLTQTVAGIRERLTVHGNDYDTPDGTCIRDYIHVVDVAEAHVSALQQLLGSSETCNRIYNIGTGNGFSVLEVIQAFEKTNGIKVPYTIGPRRPGDITQVWADTAKAERELNWKARFSLEDMMRDAWNWQKSLSTKA